MLNYSVFKNGTLLQTMWLALELEHIMGWVISPIVLVTLAVVTLLIFYKVILVKIVACCNVAHNLKNSQATSD